MATPLHTRVALSEIPDRLEQLRVATTPTTQLADEPTPANVLNVTLLDNSSDNIPLTYLSPVPSPDEIVIRQRGRRRITLSWSPEKCPSRHPVQKTPTKNAATTTTMTLRSSPRKRLLLNEGTNASPDKLSPSPRKADGGWRAGGSTHTLKRLKLEEKPLAQTNSGTPLHIMLKGLSHEQLVGVIKNLVKNDPQLEETIRSEFPMPDISPMEEQLTHIKRNIFRSLPSSRLCKKTDSTAYARAATHLTAFKKAVVSQSRILYDSKHWDALLDYISMAWNYVRATPVWDNPSHNVVRKQCFKVLTCHCAAALRNGSHRLGLQRLTDLEQDIKCMAKDCEEILSCVADLNQLLLKFRTV